jgi:hypothetical protein
MIHQRKNNWLATFLVAGVILLVIAGLALLGSYFTLSRQPSAAAPVAKPIEAVQGGAVAPDLAVLTLAGEDDGRIIGAARSAGELETAYATLAYSTLLSDSARGGDWVLLAEDFAKRGDLTRAAVAYRAAMDMASLAPTLGDQARADLSLQAARGWHRLTQKAQARLALAQAEEIARHGLSMLPAQRRSTLVRAIELLRSMGETDAAQTLNAQLAVASQGPGVQVEPPGVALPGLRGSIVLPSEVATAIAERQAAAAAMAARWLATDEQERAALSAALGAALEAEDAVRTQAYGRLGELSSADRLALLHDRIAWLTVRYRVARGGYGTSLVPAWEVEVDAIGQALQAAYIELINGYGQRIDTLDAEALDFARVELLRQGLLWSRLDLFPGDVEENLAQQLADASSQLRARLGEVGLTVAPSEESGMRFYVLTGSDGPDGQRAEGQGGS